MPNVTVMILHDGPDAGVQFDLASTPRSAIQNVLMFMGLGLSLGVLYAAYQAKQTAPLRRLAHSDGDRLTHSASASDRLTHRDSESPARLETQFSPAALSHTEFSPTDFSPTDFSPTQFSPTSVDECVVDITAVTRDEDLPPARGGVAS